MSLDRQQTDRKSVTNEETRIQKIHPIKTGGQ